MTTLKIATDLKLPLDAATQTFAFIARKGAGKTYAAAEDPKSIMRSKLPSARAASAQEASTTACPCSARLTGPPRSDGANATPIGRKREFISAAAAMAAPAPPPCARIATALN